MSRCTHERPAGRYYCKACRAEQMRDWRAAKKAKRLHAVVERLSRVPREIESNGA